MVISRDEIVSRIDALLDRPDLQNLPIVRGLLLQLREGSPATEEERRKYTHGAAMIVMDDQILAHSELGSNIFDLLRMYDETGLLNGTPRELNERYIPTSKVTRKQLVSDIDRIIAWVDDPPSPNLLELRDTLLRMTENDSQAERRQLAGRIGTLLLMPRMRDTALAMKFCSFLSKYKWSGRLT